jgi:hypothetical protein
MSKEGKLSRSAQIKFIGANINNLPIHDRKSFGTAVKCTDFPKTHIKLKNKNDTQLKFDKKVSSETIAYLYRDIKAKINRLNIERSKTLNK